MKRCYALHVVLAFALLTLTAFSIHAAQRQVVLVEHFTNTDCGPCATYNPGIHSVMNAVTRDTAIKISYHVWWPGESDPFYLRNTSEVQQRVNLYGVSGVPDLYVDYLYQPAPSSPTTFRSNIRTRYGVPSPCTIQVAAAPSGATSIFFFASVTAEQAMIGSNYRLYVCLISDLITYGSPPGSNGETSFPDPFRDMYPNANNGQSFSISAGQTYELSGLLSRDAGWAPTNLSVIAFVQNSNNREILQAEWCDVVSTAGTVTVTAPNGGETWLDGDAHNITWTSTSLPENVRIQINRSYLSTDWETIVGSTANTGSYAWTVTGPGTTTARVRVTGITQLTAGDTSNANFTIGRTVTLTAPNGGETWITPEASAITWTSMYLTENVVIELNRTYPSVTWEPIATNIPNTGTYLWTLTGPTTTTARIRIYGTVHPNVCDTSNGNFTIGTRTITVEGPNGGESWPIGEAGVIFWGSQNVPGNVSIELNRAHPSGQWEMLAASTPNDGEWDWTATAPTTSAARVRITSLSYSYVRDESNANFSIVLPPNYPPVITHDPLHDQAIATFTVTAWVTDEEPGLVTRFFYRPESGGSFDSLLLNATGNPNEYAATMAALAEGSYLYFLRAYDVQGQSATTDTFGFDVGADCPAALAYDDGSAESSHWAPSTEFQWAVKFDPLQTPYVLCGARIGISALHPDTEHSPIEVQVLNADGPGGLPGSIVLSKVAGSIGNVVGGVPTNVDNWVSVVFRNEFGNPPTFSNAFYISVANPELGKYEAFLHDTSSARAGRSYVYDDCQGIWVNELAVNLSARPGNRLIRASGFPLQPPQITCIRVGGDIRLNWNAVGAPYYQVYRASASGGAYSYLGYATTTSYADVGAASLPIRFYVVYSTTTP